MTEGAEAPTGQVIDSAAPVAELLRRVQAMPLPPARSADGQVDLRDLPGGVANTTHGEGVRRGIGYAVAYKNVGFSEGFDDYSTARVRLEAVAGEAVATVHTAAAEVGQGLVTVEQQIARTELGVRPRHRAHQGHQRRQRRIDVGVPADVRHRRRGQGGLREGARPRARRHPAADRALGAGPAARRRQGGLAAARASSVTWPTCSATRSSRRPSSGTTARPRRSTRRPARGSPTCSTLSRRTARWSTWTSSSA